MDLSERTDDELRNAYYNAQRKFYQAWDAGRDDAIDHYAGQMEQIEPILEGRGWRMLESGRGFTWTTLYIDCAHCGEPFLPIRSTARYCSDKCRVYAWRSRTPGYRHGVGLSWMNSIPEPDDCEPDDPDIDDEDIDDDDTSWLEYDKECIRLAD